MKQMKNTNCAKDVQNKITVKGADIRDVRGASIRPSRTIPSKKDKMRDPKKMRRSKIDFDESDDGRRKFVVPKKGDPIDADDARHPSNARPLPACHDWTDDHSEEELDAMYDNDFYSTHYDESGKTSSYLVLEDIARDIERCLVENDAVNGTDIYVERGRPVVVALLDDGMRLRVQLEVR